MKTPTDSLAIVTLTKDRPDLIRDLSLCLIPALRALPFPTVVEKWLVQNGTDAETVPLAESYGWNVLAYGRNTSFSEGNNLAVKQTTTSHILLLNNDCLPGNPQTIAAMWEHREKPIVGAFILQPGVGCVNHAGIAFIDSMITPGDLSSFGIEKHPLDMCPVHIGRSGNPASFLEDRYVSACTFAAVLIKRELWDALGGLDEAYHYSYEDIDFCLKALESGGVRCFIPRAAEFNHQECTTRKPLETDKENFLYYRKKWCLSLRAHDALGIAKGL